MWPGCIFTAKTLVGRKATNKIHPIADDLTGLFVRCLAAQLPNTAWCVDLARTAVSAEIIARSKGLETDLFVMNAIRDKIEKDKGVKIY